MKTTSINDIQDFLKSMNEERTKTNIKNIQDFLNKIPNKIPENILEELTKGKINNNRLKELSKFYEKYVKISKECYLEGKGEKKELDKLLMEVKYRVFAELVKDIFIHNNSENKIKDLNKRWKFWDCKIKDLRDLNNILEGNYINIGNYTNKNIVKPNTKKIKL